MFFSIVIPLYNKEHQIADTLRSVFAQSFTDYEIVIVNDGSTDNSVTAVEAIDDPRIRLISQANAGVSAARNRGIEEARGKYIALLDADDLWHPDFLTTIADLIARYPKCDVFATRYDFTDEFGNKKPSIINNFPFNGKDGILSNYFEVAINSDAPLWTSVVVTSKNALQSVGGFPVGITSGEDLLTWARLACRFKIAFSQTVCATYYTPTTGPTGIVPIDLKSTKDAVGTALQKLNKECPDKGVAKYISYWYKMRAAINIRRRNRWATLKCASKSLKFNPFGIKSWVLVILSFSPSPIISKIMGK